MSTSPRRSGSRRLLSRSASYPTIRSPRPSSHRNAAQQTSETNGRSRRDTSSQRPSSPPRSVSSNRPRPSSPSPTRPPPRKRFGLTIPTNQPKVIGRFDFEDKYPEDPINEEMSSNARVWRANLDECEVFDNDMVTEARDGLDLLLVFAGLFSAVLTTFVAQTSQALSANFLAISTSLLVEMVTLQRAQMNGTSVDAIPFATTTSGPSGFDVWVNALWFTSLTLSLGTALMAVLVKQWLHQYMSMISGTARDRSLVRHYRFDGLQKWHVLIIIGTLPIILHIALGLFLAGLVIFLIPLNIPLACVVGSITLVIYVAYAVSNILPIIYTQCPYRTPFSDILNVVIRTIHTWPSLSLAYLYRGFSAFGRVAGPSIVYVFQTLKEAERSAATGNGVAEDVACDALMWLYQMTSNPPTKNVILESLGCLSDAVSERLQVVEDHLMHALRETIRQNDSLYAWAILPGQERRAERLLRAIRYPPTPYHAWTLDSHAFEHPMQVLASVLSHTSSVDLEVDFEEWDRPRFLAHLVRQHINGIPTLLLSMLWDHIISWMYSEDGPRLIGMEDDTFVLPLCRLALQNFSPTKQQIAPFSGAVQITHETVPLFGFVVDLLISRFHVHDLPPDAEPIAKLFIIHDYAVSCLPVFKGIHGSDVATAVLNDVWNIIRHLDGLSGDEVCRRAERTVLQSLELDDGWCDGSWHDGEPVRIGTLECYMNILSTYRRYPEGWHGVPSEFLARLLSDLSLSLKSDLAFKYLVFDVLEAVFKEQTNVPIDHSLLTASPFLSTRTPVSFASSRHFLYFVVAAFVVRFTRGNSPRELSLQFLNGLCTDPQRLYTVCRILALGGPEWYSDDHLKQCLLGLARLDPTHEVWKSRAQYMAMEPRDWPYLCLVEQEMNDGEMIADVMGAMKKGLAILDEFFDSANDTSPIESVIQTAPPRRNTVSYWRRIAFGTGTLHLWDRTSRMDGAENREFGLHPAGEVTSAIDHSHPSTPGNVPTTSVWKRLRCVLLGPANATRSDV